MNMIVGLAFKVGFKFFKDISTLQQQIYQLLHYA